MVCTLWTSIFRTVLLIVPMLSSCHAIDLYRSEYLLCVRSEAERTAADALNLFALCLYHTTETPFTRHNRLSNRLNNRPDNRLDNRLRRVGLYKHSADCQAGWRTGMTTGWMIGYTMQPVVQTVVQPVCQPVVSCKRGPRKDYRETYVVTRWCNGKALDLWSVGRGFKSSSRQRRVTTLGKLFTPITPLSSSSITWYRPKGGDALRLGR